MEKSFWRGHQIVFVNKKWVYSDTNELITENKNRMCGFCSIPNIEDCDPCLGILPGVINACCGHGNPSEAYVCFENGVRLAGFVIEPLSKTPLGLTT